MNPLDVANAALGPVAKHVLLIVIFFDTSDQHLRWQKFHRLVFVLACEDVFQFNITGPNTGGREPYERWKTMTEAEKFDELNLGDINDIPVKRTLTYQKPVLREVASVSSTDAGKFWEVFLYFWTPKAQDAQKLTIIEGMVIWFLILSERDIWRQLQLTYWCSRLCAQSTGYSHIGRVTQTSDSPPRFSHSIAIYHLA